MAHVHRMVQPIGVRHHICSQALRHVPERLSATRERLIEPYGQLFRGEIGRDGACAISSGLEVFCNESDNLGARFRLSVALQCFKDRIRHPINLSKHLSAHRSTRCRHQSRPRLGTLTRPLTLVYDTEPLPFLSTVRSPPILSASTLPEPIEPMW